MDDSTSASSSSSSFTATSVRSKQERLQQLQLERRQLENQLRMQTFAAGYEVELEWPAVVEIRGRTKHAEPVTSNELIQHRLLEAGMLYEVPAPLHQVMESANRFVADLEQSQCFQKVQVQIGTARRTTETANGGATNDSTTTTSESTAPPPSSSSLRQLTVHLQEAKWYKLYAGGGVKATSLLGESSSGLPLGSTGAFLPTAEVECSVWLRNLTGYLDATQFRYTVDSHSLSSWRLHHQRPLYSAVPSSWRNWVLGQSTGSQTRFEVEAVLDTVDHEWTRSYKEFQRWLSCKLVDPINHWSLEWSALGRDVVPRRHAHLPYCLAASPEIVAQAGPSVRHAVTLEYQPPLSSPHTTASPSSPWRWHGKVQVATPPGDVGYCKVEGGLGWGVGAPLGVTRRLQFQSSVRAGYLKSLSFGGRTPRGAGIPSDRFYVGGPLPLRGFGPSGIGPRSTSGKSAGGPGDSLGGDFYYTAAFLASVQPFAGGGPLDATSGERAAASSSSSTDAMLWSSLRAFAFLNVGTCVGNVATLSPLSVIRSTRAAVGVGVATEALGPRVEVAYAIPLRYDPTRDVRKTFQFGIGVSL